VAHRTSPTNIGLTLLANLTAIMDFGYLPTGRLLERTTKALRSMATLERHRGHFYNWYDTQSSSRCCRSSLDVDSGNLAGHLLTLRVGLLALPDNPICRGERSRALADTLAVLSESSVGDVSAPHTELRRELDSAVAAGVTTLGDAHDAWRPAGSIWPAYRSTTVQRSLRRQCRRAGGLSQALLGQCRARAR